MAGHAHSNQAEKQYKGSVMCVNMEHGELQAKSCDIEELPASSRGKAASVDERPAPCEGPGT